MQLDYTSPSFARQAQDAVVGVDVVVNAVGIFREDGNASFDAVHVKGPCSLFAHAAKAGVRRIIQISALGAAAEAATPYLRSKAAGDQCARAFAGEAVVVRPSLVFAPAGASSRMFLRLAWLPWVVLPGGGRQCVQPLHLDDLVEGLAKLAAADTPLPADSAGAGLDAVGPTPLSLADYLRALGRAIGARPRIIGVPQRWAQAAARLLQRVPGSLVTTDALAMLRQGSCADPAAWQRLVARPLRCATGSGAQGFIEPDESDVLRDRIALANLLPLLRASVSAMWLVTAWVSAFVYPVADSLALLQRSHMPTALAPLALYGASALDAALGLAMWMRRWRAVVYRLQLTLILFYTLVITVALPEFWAHPYGPVLKNVPLLALIYALLRLEARDGPGDR